MDYHTIKSTFINNETIIEMNAETNFSLVEEPKGKFADNQVRNDFIKKVYSILSLILLVTIVGVSVIIFFFKDNFNIRKLVDERNNAQLACCLILLIGSAIVSMAIVCAFSCFESIRKQVPLNYILLGLLTISETIFVAIICCQYYGLLVLMALIITAVVVLAVTLLAMTPWFDITNCGCLLCILLLIHTIMGFVLFGVMLLLDVSRQDMKPWLLIFSIAGAFLFSLYLLYDTQQILGGKKVELSPEEYILAVIHLYIDIIMIFLYVLQILGLVHATD